MASGDLESLSGSALQRFEIFMMSVSKSVTILGHLSGRVS
jgi:hypothetical protein